MKSKYQYFLLTAASLALVGGSPTAFAARDALNETVSVDPAKPLSAHDADVMSAAADKVMVHIAEARGDIHTHKFDEAKDELKQARTLLEIIRADMPAMKVKDRITVAQKHLEYMDAEDVIPDLVPIYSELDVAETQVPRTREAREHLDKAKINLKNNDKKSATAELQAADAALVYGEIDMPLIETQRNVEAALNALDKKKTEVAERDLRAAEAAVQVNFDELVFPAKGPAQANKVPPVSPRAR